MNKILSLFLISIYILGGCAHVEKVGTYVQDINLVSVEDEKKIGVQMNEQIASEMTIVTDAAPNQRVNKIGQELLAALPEKKFETKFYVVKDDTPNAFAVPGGSIYIHTGLLDFTDDDELAGVMAHELAHVQERHPSKNLTRIYGAEFISGLLVKDDANQMKKLALDIAKGGVLAKFSRDDESEADELGYEIIEKTGYSEDGLVKFLSKLEAAGGSKPFLVFLSTHPSTSDRIEKLEELEKKGG